jgi:hypothetical protein
MILDMDTLQRTIVIFSFMIQRNWLQFSIEFETVVDILTDVDRSKFDIFVISQLQATIHNNQTKDPFFLFLVVHK